MDPQSRTLKKNTSHGNEVLPQDTTHLIQRPCYQRGSPCQDPAGNRTTRRPPYHRKETQTAVVCSCLPFIKSGRNNLARHSETGEEDKADRGRGGKTTSGNGLAWSSPSPRGQWRTGNNWGNWLRNQRNAVPQRPLRLRDRWDEMRWERQILCVVLWFSSMWCILRYFPQWFITAVVTVTCICSLFVAHIQV